MTKSPYIESTNDQEWKNWHKTLEVGGEVNKILVPFNRYIDNSPPPAGKEFMPGLEGLQQIIKEAENAQARVRAHGSRWSLNNVAFTNAYLVDSRKLGFYKIGIEEVNFVTASYQDKRDCLSFVQCGVMVKDLNSALKIKGQALRTSGASDGQTLIGAISTGTHGSANKVGAMTEYVRGIHLVISEKHVFVQRESDQAVTNEFSNWLGQASFVLDDNLFNAALVGFGSFGFVHGLLIETEPLYLLERVIKNYDFPDVFKAITELDMSGLDLPEGDQLPFHFEVALNPYRLGKDEKGAFVRVYYKRPFKDDMMARVSRPKDGIYDLHTAMAHTFSENKEKEIEDIEKTSPEETVSETRIRNMGIAVQIALTLSFPVSAPGKTDIRYPGDFFTSDNSANETSPSPIPATSLEVGVPFERIGDAVDLIQKVVLINPFAAPLALRYVKKSTATLGFTGLAPITVTMEMPGPFGIIFFPRTGAGHKAIFEALAESNIPHTYHWGQQLPQNAAWAPKAYGSALDLWKEQRQKFLGEAGIKMFSNQFIESFLKPGKKQKNFFWTFILSIVQWVKRRLSA